MFYGGPTSTIQFDQNLSSPKDNVSLYKLHAIARRVDRDEAIPT